MTRKQTAYPVLRYDDAPGAIDWLKRTLGFEEHVVYPGEGGTIDHAQLAFDGDLVMLGSAGEGRPKATGNVYLVSNDPDALYARAVDAGADVAHEIADQDYGSRDFTLRDPEGNLWSVGTYQPHDA